MVERRRTTTWLTWVAAGLIIGAVECVLAIAFAAFVFGRAALVRDLPAGIGLYLGAAVLTLGFLAWRAGPRGVVGSVQDAPAAVLASVATVVAAKAAELAHTAQISGLTDYDPPDVFLTVVTAGILVTVLCGIVFAVIGRFRLGGLIRFVPYPVVGGFLAGTGWLLFKGGVNAAAGMQVKLRNLGQLFEFQLSHLLPALAFGVILLIAVRVIKRPLVIPAVIGIGLVVFVIGMVVTGSSIEEVREGGWLLFGGSETTQLWEFRTFEALAGADWASVLESWAGIVTAVFVATLAILFNISGTELVLDRDLDTNKELRDAGVLNVVSGALGGIPGYHALSLTALAERMRVDARAAGLDRGGGPAGRGRVRRLGRGADPADDRRGRAGLHRPGLPGRVGLGQAEAAAAARIRRRGGDPGRDHRVGVPGRRGDRPGARGRAVRRELRPDRAGERGRLRRDLSLERRSAGERACRAARALGARPDPAGERVRVLRVDEPPAGAGPPADGRRPRPRGSW